MVLAAFLIVLHKYTLEEEVLIGTSTENFNPLVLRLPVQDDQTITSVIAAVVAAEELSVAKDVPFDALNAELAKEHDANAPRAPLLTVRCFNAVDVDASTLDATAMCEWTLLVEQDRDSKRLLPLSLRLIYNSVLFRSERMSEVLHHIEIILSQIAKADDTLTVRDCEIAASHTPGARVIPDPLEELDSTWVGAAFDHFSDWAKKDPERPAVVHGEKTFSYKYLDDFSNRVAHYLIKQGVVPGDVVTMYAHRSTAIVIGIMGILKAGATFSVIDPAYPVERQQVYLFVAQPKAILSLKLAGVMNPEVQKYIDTELNICCQLNGLHEDEPELLAEYESTSCGVVVQPYDVATLSFTSGSTGIPKGVRGQHISLTHFFPWMMTKFGLGEKDRFTMLSGIAHDPIQRDVFTPLFMGATIYIPDQEDIVSPGQLAQWMATNQVTVAHLTPAMNQLVTANAEAPMPHLRRVFLVGDILTKRDVMRLQALADNVEVINMYGTTETQRAVSYFHIKNDGSIGDLKEILPAGWGMKDVQLLILTDSGKVAGIGELGEIYVRSPCMSRGYLGLDKVTAEKFVNNPFRPDDSKDKMYRTGDLGRYMPDGVVECVGRADDQVKIRGFRIELGEIDTHLGQHPDVRENITLVKRDANEEKTIISYFVPKIANQFDINSMRDALKAKLPVYSIPSVFVPLVRMPLTPNAKIDRAKLPYPDAAVIALQNASRKQSSSGVTHETNMHVEIKDIWRNVLGRAVGVHDNFFDVGGHSIFATRVTFEMRKRLKLELPLDLLYRCGTIDQVVKQISKDELTDALGFEEADGTSDIAQLDVEGQVVLDASITCKGLPELAADSVQTVTDVLLTGGTGFLGAFLLSRLLVTHPNAMVHCIVRAKDNAAAYARVEKALKQHFLWRDDYGHRINAVCGDLSAEDNTCGVDAAVWDEWATKVDLIVHNGALVHWVYPYAKLKAANVTSVVSLLALACTHKRKPFHFVSSTAVFEASHYLGLTQPVKERDPLVAGNGIGSGYGQTKWVAENIIALAAERGLPTYVYRSSYITGDSRTGVTNVDDYLVRLVKGCIELGVAPEMVNKLNCCPVDFVADTIAHVTTATPEVRDGINNTYHFLNPTSYRFVDFFEDVARYGFDVKPDNYMEWKGALEELTMTSKENALYPLLHFVMDDLPQKSRGPSLDTTMLWKALEGSNIECPSVTSLMGIYLSYLVHSGYLEPPTLANLEGIEALPALDITGEIGIVRRSGN
ncbi:hypothetical protein SARC_07039 [Sphaeroforma arctica JP610]|uniref:Carrier domain-containing protein n=1 Tax=Sphaeroforma arctica JP610 TaxID=667725 RepID=A0A0L0FXD8_9EUKA|nr:hypothetical protein SARC_07039 [Sphaeroforma arctica JP610]KNC80603.1 hypothetical protein SARC_07039 [Sphaeroforma arctica JP610]|eukprot:XP_014154505.1 hypothetical protein SARC_07039 [Sphaeroforma arctica JP610]